MTDRPAIFIETAGLDYSIGKRLILKNISLSVATGEYLTLAGPNGAGKTTLLKCLGGLLGQRLNVTVLGKPLYKYARKELAKLIGYVPQYSVWDGSFTVYEFVMLGRYPYLQAFGTPTTADRDVVERMLGFTGLTAYAATRLSNLSGGERQKVFIAAALAQQSRLLLLDEPTTFLDPRHEAEISELILRINREYGVTVVTVTHDINTAAANADRVVAIKDGQVAFNGPARDFMQNDVLKRIYDKDFVFATHPQTGIPVVVPSRIG